MFKKKTVARDTMLDCKCFKIKNLVLGPQFKFFKILSLVMAFSQAI